jgi:hypothetical protein
MNDTARARLERVGWRPDRRYRTEEIAQRLKARGFDLFPAAGSFLERYGGLAAQGYTIHRRSTGIYFHTSPDDVATDHLWIPEWEQVTGTRVFPIGATAYDEYVLLMDEHGRVFGSDMYLEMTYWADDGEELLDIVLGDGGTFRPIDADDRRPIERRS